MVRIGPVLGLTNKRVTLSQLWVGTRQSLETSFFEKLFTAEGIVVNAYIITLNDSIKKQKKND